MDLEIHREIQDGWDWRSQSVTRQGRIGVAWQRYRDSRCGAHDEVLVFYSYYSWLVFGCWLLSSSWLLLLLLLQVIQIASCIKQCSSFVIDASCIFDVSQMMLRLVLNTIVACTQITFNIPCTAKVRLHEYKHANTHVVGFKSNSTKWYLHDHFQYFLFQHRNGSSPPFQWVMHFQMMDSSCPL